ncbi:MAG: hypothetical protein EXR45_06560 [Chloroflexi bacterium]|nr:hypothetical protein [Chloroflexota bacterium]
MGQALPPRLEQLEKSGAATAPPLRPEGGREARRPPGSDGKRFEEHEGPGGALGVVFVVAQAAGFIGIPGLVTYFGYQYLRRSPGNEDDSSGDHAT